jgi:hypothetical protein
MAEYMKNIMYGAIAAAAIAFGINQFTGKTQTIIEPTKQENIINNKNNIDKRLENILNEIEKEKITDNDSINNGFIDPEKFTGTSADKGIEVYMNNIQLNESEGYQMSAKTIPITIKIPGTKDDNEKTLFITYTHSEDAHYFIPNSGKLVKGRFNQDDGKVWYQTVLDSEGLKLRAGPGSSKTTEILGHCNEIYAIALHPDQAKMLPSHIGLHGLKGFKDMYSTKDTEVVISNKPVRVCAEDNNPTKIRLVYQ